MKTILLLILSIILSFANLNAQTITGSIIDVETGEYIPGVVVRIGTLKTTTNNDGSFAAPIAKGNYELFASHIAYQTFQKSITIPAKSPFNIKLKKKVAQLEEVSVSTGYQTLPKERATGSFSVVSQKKLAEQVGSNIINRLEGITPSLTFDRRSNGGSMMIRGLSTLRSNRGPLVILDNFPYEGNVDNINPADVESVTILKDAAAASIWGARAGNGVIVITTKKGKYNEKTTLSVGGGLSALQIPDASYNRNMAAADLIANEQMLFSKGYYTSLETATGQPALSPVVELMIATGKGEMSAQAFEDALSRLAVQDVAVNYGDAFYRTGLNQQYYLNGQGGNVKMNWKVFAGADKNQSVLSARYQRYQLKFDQNWQLVKNLEVGLNLNYTLAKTQGGKTGLNSFVTATGNLPVYTRFVDDSGNQLPIMRDYSSRYIVTAGNGRLQSWDYYPLQNSEIGQSKSITGDILGSFTAGYKVLKGLRVSFNYLYERQAIESVTNYSQNSYYTRSIVNTFTAINGKNIIRAIPLGAIRDNNQQTLQVHNLRAQLNYDRNFKAFNLNILGGAEQRQGKGEGRDNRFYGLDEETLISQAVDYANSYRNFVLGSNGYIPYRDSFSGTDNRFVSVYSNGAISFKNRYTVSVSARRDGSNLFGVNTNQKWKPLWSAGLAWQVSEESFAKNWPYLRLRTSYGSSGNANSRLAAVTTISYDANSPYTQSPSASFSNYANPELRWEVVKTLNLAVDFRFFNNRLNGSIDYFVKNASDLIGTAPIDYTAGIGFVSTRNAAKISARGLDVELDSKNLSGTFSWTTNLFANFYKDRVDEYYLEPIPASNFVNGDANINGIKGMPVYAVYGYKWAGLNPVNGNPRGYVNGSLSEDYDTITGSNTGINDLDYIGRAFPTITGALGNQFDWKGFNLNFRIGYKFGYYFRRSSINYGMLYASRIGDEEYASRWQVAGDELKTNVPSEVYPASGARDSFYNYSTATIIRGDHIRIQSIGLGYAFNKIRLPHLPFQHVNLIFQANNLGLLWISNKDGIDPDFPLNKPFQTYSLNMKVTF